MTYLAKASGTLVPAGRYLFKELNCRPLVSCLRMPNGRYCHHLTGFNPSLRRIESNATHALSRPFASDVRRPQLNEKKIQQLNLAGKLVLLSLNDKGIIPYFRDALQISVTAAILLDLIAKNAIKVENGKVQVQSSEVTLGSPELECIAKIRDALHPLSLKEWIDSLSHSSLLYKVAQELLSKSFLTEKKPKGFWNNLYIMPRYELYSPSSREQIVSDLRNAVLSLTTKIDSRTALLLTLCKHSDLLENNIFTEQELGDKKTRIEEISQEKLLNETDRALASTILEQKLPYWSD